jgi:hypothetical protein
VPATALAVAGVVRLGHEAVRPIVAVEHEHGIGWKRLVYADEPAVDLEAIGGRPGEPLEFEPLFTRRAWHRGRFGIAAPSA